MEVRTGHLPMCTSPNGTCSSGMVLHMKSYALHGLISHRDHSNVNHISSSILLNICIKTMIHQSIAQRHYKNLQYKIGEKDKMSYWASIHKKRKVSRKISSKPCKWGDVARGCPDMWVKWEPRMHNVICGCLCRRRAVPVMDALFFPRLFFPLIFLALFFYFLFSSSFFFLIKS